MMRYFKKCEEFAICSEVGESNFLFPETSDERRTLYQIVVKGEGRVGRIFDSEYTELNEKNNNFVHLVLCTHYQIFFQLYLFPLQLSDIKFFFHLKFLEIEN